MPDHWLHQSDIGFDKETRMGYVCNIINYGCAYDCAVHLVPLKWSHCRNILWILKWDERPPQLYVLTWRVT
jgi:hypothetical protein